MTYSLHYLNSEYWVEYLRAVFEEYIALKFPELKMSFDEFDLFLRVFISSTVNQFWMYDDECNLIGVGTIKAPSNLINHSCEPSILHHTEENRIVFRACKPIQKGDAVFMTYIDGKSMPFKHRQDFLEKHWGFRCLCPTCQKDKLVENDP